MSNVSSIAFTLPDNYIIIEVTHVTQKRSASRVHTAFPQWQHLGQ